MSAADPAPVVVVLQDGRQIELHHVVHNGVLRGLALRGDRAISALSALQAATLERAPVLISGTQRLLHTVEFFRPAESPNDIHVRLYSEPYAAPPKVRA